MASSIYLNKLMLLLILLPQRGKWWHINKILWKPFNIRTQQMCYSYNPSTWQNNSLWITVPFIFRYTNSITDADGCYLWRYAHISLILFPDIWWLFAEIEKIQTCLENITDIIIDLFLPMVSSIFTLSFTF